MTDMPAIGRSRGRHGRARADRPSRPGRHAGSRGREAGTIISAPGGNGRRRCCTQTMILSRSVLRLRVNFGTDSGSPTPERTHEAAERLLVKLGLRPESEDGAIYFRVPTSLRLDDAEFVRRALE